MQSTEFLQNRIRECLSRRNSAYSAVAVTNRHQILADIAELRFRQECSRGSYSHTRQSDSPRVITPRFTD